LLYAGGMDIQKFILESLRLGKSRRQIEVLIVTQFHIDFIRAQLAFDEATKNLVDSCMATTQQQFKAQLIEQIQTTHAAAIEGRNHGAAIAAANSPGQPGKLVLSC